MNLLHQWAERHNVTPAALADLAALLSNDVAVSLTGGLANESDVQNRIRLEASRRGWLLFRNNVGAGKLDNGSFVRWGLANDSEALNRRCKSADLIGVRPIRIQPAHVGHTLGQFVSIECKRAGWAYRGNDRERAQMKWATTIQSAGGHAVFATGPEGI